MTKKNHEDYKNATIYHICDKELWCKVLGMII